MSNCKHCSKVLTKKANKYCNKDCYFNATFQLSIEKFYKGLICDNKTIKKILIFINGERCVECTQGNEWNGLPLTLEVDHIDGNSDNNDPNNVRLLCPNCHSQTPTSRGKNERKNTKRNKYLRNYKS